jgi:hypothetical protein
LAALALPSELFQAFGRIASARTPSASVRLILPTRFDHLKDLFMSSSPD